MEFECPERQTAHARKQRGFISCAQHFRLVLKTLGV